MSDGLQNKTKIQKQQQPKNKYFVKSDISFSNYQYLVLLM